MGNRLPSCILCSKNGNFNKKIAKKWRGHDTTPVRPPPLVSSYAHEYKQQTKPHQTHGLLAPSVLASLPRETTPHDHPTPTDTNTSEVSVSLPPVLPSPDQTRTHAPTHTAAPGPDPTGLIGGRHHALTAALQVLAVPGRFRYRPQPGACLLSGPRMR